MTRGLLLTLTFGLCLWTLVCGQCNFTVSDSCAVAHNAIFNATRKNDTCSNYTATVNCVLGGVPLVCLGSPSPDVATFFTNAQIEDNCCGDPLASVLMTANLPPHNCSVPTVSKCNITAAVTCVQTFTASFQTASYLNYTAYCPDYNYTMICISTYVPATDGKCQKDMQTQPSILKFFTDVAKTIDNCCAQQASSILSAVGMTADSCAGGTGAAPTTTTTAAPGATTTTPPVGSCNVAFAGSYCLPPFKQVYANATTYTSICPDYLNTISCIGQWIPQSNTLCAFGAVSDATMSSFLNNEATAMEDCCANPLASVMQHVGPVTPCPPGGLIPTTTTPAPTTPAPPTTPTVNPPTTQPPAAQPSTVWTIPVLLTTTEAATTKSSTWSKDGPVAQISIPVLIVLSPFAVIGGFALFIKKMCY